MIMAITKAMMMPVRPPMMPPRPMMMAESRARSSTVLIWLVMLSP